MVLGLLTGEKVQIIYISNHFNEAKHLYMKQSQHHMLHLPCHDAEYIWETWTIAHSLDLPPPHWAGT